MISPLCTNCHDITVILLNMALNTINLTLYLQRYIPTYLSTSLCMWTYTCAEREILYNTYQEMAIGNRLLHLYTDIYLPMAGENIYIKELFPLL
jgi:hypothetical protein